MNRNAQLQSTVITLIRPYTPCDTSGPSLRSLTSHSITGTPLQNDTAELLNLLRFLMPSLFGTEEEEEDEEEEGEGDKEEEAAKSGQEEVGVGCDEYGGLRGRRFESSKERKRQPDMVLGWMGRIGALGPGCDGSGHGSCCW